MNSFIKPARLVADKLQSVLKVLLTDPDADKMEYFSKILAELKEIAKFYSYGFPEFIESTKSKTVRTKYSQGGDCVHRGLLCPSPILNLIAGCNKGIWITSADEATDNYYKYRFDADNKLLSVNHYNYSTSKTIPDNIEFILRRDNIEYGITFHSSWNEVSSVSKSVYADGHLENYAFADYDHSTPDEMFLHYEEFIYENDQPIQADVYFGISPQLDLFTLDTFHLSYEMDHEVSLQKISQNH